MSYDKLFAATTHSDGDNIIDDDYDTTSMTTVVIDLDDGKQRKWRWFVNNIGHDFDK